MLSFSFHSEENGGAMNAIESTASAEPLTLVTLINRTLEGETEGGKETSAGGIANSLERVSELLPEDEQTKARQYVIGLQSFYRDTVITTLDPGLGGLYDGSKRFVAVSTLEVDDRDPMQTIEQAREADKHEKKHQEGDHTGVYQTYEDPSGSSQFLVLGGVEFDHTALIEGHTVDATGTKYVSDQYKGFRTQFIAAIDSSGLSKDQVTHVIDVTHDLTEIDDRALITPAASL